MPTITEDTPGLHNRKEKDLTVLSVSHKIVQLGSMVILIIKGGLFCNGNERPCSEWVRQC
jgi:hypothetical protein